LGKLYMGTARVRKFCALGICDIQDTSEFRARLLHTGIPVESRQCTPGGEGSSESDRLRDGSASLSSSAESLAAPLISTSLSHRFGLTAWLHWRISCRLRMAMSFLRSPVQSGSSALFSGPTGLEETPLEQHHGPLIRSPMQHGYGTRFCMLLSRLSSSQPRGVRKPLSRTKKHGLQRKDMSCS
jgi:hypothetical protein